MTVTTRELGPVAYQHISNGGFAFQTILTKYTGDSGAVHHKLDLEIRQSCMGVGVSVSIPLFETTADILEDIVKRIRDHAPKIDPAYLGAVTAVLETADDIKLKTWRPRKPVSVSETPPADLYGDLCPDDIQVGDDEPKAEGVSSLTDTPEDTSGPTLSELMEQHRIAVYPEYESTVWNAEVYDNESATPTRKAVGRNPLEAVQLALKKPVPEFGDALDQSNQPHEYTNTNATQTGAPE